MSDVKYMNRKKKRKMLFSDVKEKPTKFKGLFRSFAVWTRIGNIRNTDDDRIEIPVSTLYTKQV